MLEKYRTKIDEIDCALLKLLAERLTISKEIGKHKKRNNISIQNKEREKQVITERIQKFKELGFDDENFMVELFELILKKSREVQQEQGN